MKTEAIEIIRTDGPITTDDLVDILRKIGHYVDRQSLFAELTLEMVAGIVKRELVIQPKKDGEVNGRICFMWNVA